MENTSAVPRPPLPPKEIEIFTQEQLEMLPQEAKESIIALETNLPSKELLVLNPLVSELLKIKELANLKYNALPEDATKEQIEAHKLNIEEFKAAKKSIVALNQKNADTKKALKGPLDLLGKQVLTIEKSVKAIAEEVLETLEKTFKPYLDAEAEKLRIAREKKEAKEKEAINALTQQNSEQAAMYKKSQALTFLKYEILTATKNAVNTAIESFGYESLIEYIELLDKSTFETLAHAVDFSILTSEEIAGAKAVFELEKKSLITNMKNKALTLKLELDAYVNRQNNTVPKPVEQMNTFDVIQNQSSVPFGSGINPDTVPVQIYPNSSTEVNFLDLVIKEILNCRQNISYIVNRFQNDSDIVKTPADLVNIQRVINSDSLLKKTELYILNQLPPKAPTQ